MRWVAENFELVSESDAWLGADEATVEVILRNDMLDASEIQVFNALLRWARAQLKEKKLDETPENLRAVLNNVSCAL